MSDIIDYLYRAICIIFGDGSGAVIVETNTEGYGLQDEFLLSDVTGREHLKIVAGGSLKPASAETVANKEHYVFQDGRTVFKFAVSNMADACQEIMERNKLTGDDISWLVPHQANKRIIDAAANKIGRASCRERE